MHTILPTLSPTIRRALAFGVLLVAGTLAYRFYPDQTSTITTPHYTRAEQAAQNSLDSDQDGIPDWQERLVGTNPYDATDTPDPLRIYLAPGQITNPQTATDTPTSAVARSLLDQYVALKNSGIYSDTTGTQLARSVADNIAIPISFTPYAANAVLVDKTVTKQQYRSAMQEATAPLLELPAGESELAIIALASQSGDQSRFAQVLDIATTYENTAAAIMRVSVPPEAAIFHLNAANSLSAFASVLRAMVANYQDPIASLVLLRSYNDAESGLLASFNVLGTYYRNE